MDDNTLDFNFWPSFSDLMLILVLILVIVVFAVIASIPAVDPVEPPPVGTHDLTLVKQNQMAMINAISSDYNVEPIETDKDTFRIRIPNENGGYSEIFIQNEATLQRYSFSDRILFKPDKYNLNKEGEKTLQIVGRQIKRKLKDFSEIQIQGHADPDRPAYEPSNLHLAAKRAIEVFTFLQKRVHIDPARHLMSATSFGEYKPVQRSDKDRTYTPQKLKIHNSTRKLKDKNRRIEILLIYRQL